MPCRGSLPRIPRRLYVGDTSSSPAPARCQHCAARRSTWATPSSSSMSTPSIPSKVGAIDIYGISRGKRLPTEFTAFLSPREDSCKRRVPKSWASTTATWSMTTARPGCASSLDTPGGAGGAPPAGRGRQPVHRGCGEPGCELWGVEDRAEAARCAPETRTHYPVRSRLDVSRLTVGRRGVSTHEFLE